MIYLVRIPTPFTLPWVYLSWDSETEPGAHTYDYDETRRFASKDEASAAGEAWLRIMGDTPPPFVEVVAVDDWLDFCPFHQGIPDELRAWFDMMHRQYATENN